MPPPKNEVCGSVECAAEKLGSRACDALGLFQFTKSPGLNAWQLSAPTCMCCRAGRLRDQLVHPGLTMSTEVQCLFALDGDKSQACSHLKSACHCSRHSCTQALSADLVRVQQLVEDSVREMATGERACMQARMHVWVRGSCIL